MKIGHNIIMDSQPIIVLKFGGAAVSQIEQFAHIAEIILKKSLRAKVVAVVSAMGDTTDQLLALSRKVHPNPPAREQDMLISVGERISVSLLAMALHAKDREAVSFTGSQSGMITCGNHREARILNVKPHRILRALEEQKIVLVAGFQGVSKEGEITTLGRGGSDTSAVALAVALRAIKVEFYKDVEGIYSADPKSDPNAAFLSHLSFDEAIAIAKKGAQILHLRCLELAKNNHLPLNILSFYDPSLRTSLGTVIGPSRRTVFEPVIFEGSNDY